MNSLQQPELIAWLRQQSQSARGWLYCSQLLGLLSACLIVAHGWLLADILHQLMVMQVERASLSGSYLTFMAVITLRALVVWLRERVNFCCGSRIRSVIRQQLLDQLEQQGPIGINDRSVGSWSSTLLEQVENLQDYFARYLPQRSLVLLMPLTILTVIFPINWMAGVILLITAPLIPLFMMLVGQQAAEANRRNFQALARLSGHFLDRLRGLETLRLFYRAHQACQEVAQISQCLRQRTMAVLRLAFISSALLEFFAALSIALVALYFGFSYLGAFNFGAYQRDVTLFSGFLVLILAPEFYQPLRDLGTFYHAKAQAVAAAQLLLVALRREIPLLETDQQRRPDKAAQLTAQDLEIYSPQGKRLVGPLNFVVEAGSHIVIVGASGAGKSTLINLLLGFLPYRGTLTIDGVALRNLDRSCWRRQITWVGQTPQLLNGTLLDNIKLGDPAADDHAVATAVRQAAVEQFLPELPQGLLTTISNNASELSVGQAQRIAVARALLRRCDLLLLDEPTASLDTESERLVLQALTNVSHRQTTLTITHRLETLQASDHIWVMQQGQIVQQGSYAALSRQPGPLVALLTQHQPRSPDRSPDRSPEKESR